jgi:hypothetical protein
MNSGSKTTPGELATYQIRVKGHLGSQWADWFDNATITLDDSGETLITCKVVDQSALFGLLKKVRNLGLTLISFNPIASDDIQPHQSNKQRGEKMKVFVAGASGATGKQLVAHLLERGQQVVTVVRSVDSLSDELWGHKNISVVQASLLDLSDTELVQLVNGCNAVASCLGHNLTFKGIFGRPRQLVADATRRLCQAIKTTAPQTPVRFVLMNTVGNRNRDLNEQGSFSEKIVLGFFRVVLPPQADNELAADYLRTEIGQNDADIEWVVVRPDALLNQDIVTEYTLHPSPTRSPIFNPGQTSRINVGHFMAELITDDATWNKWKGQMPVIYNKTAS